MFRKTAIAFALFASAALPLAAPAEAGVGAADFGANAAINNVAPIEDAQFVFGGRNFCWYPGGWRGAGWYWCGYAYRSGLGWGGGVGWNGWAGGGWRGGHGGWHGGGWRGGRVGGGWRGGHMGGGWRGGHMGGGRMGGGHGGHGGGHGGHGNRKH